MTSGPTGKAADRTQRTHRGRWLLQPAAEVARQLKSRPRPPWLAAPEIRHLRVWLRGRPRRRGEGRSKDLSFRESRCAPAAARARIGRRAMFESRCMPAQGQRPELRGNQAPDCLRASSCPANDPAEAEALGADGRLLHRRQPGHAGHAAAPLPGQPEGEVPIARSPAGSRRARVSPIGRASVSTVGERRLRA